MFAALPDHNLTMIFFKKYIRNKYENKEAMKIICSSGIYKTFYHIGSYLGIVASNIKQT